MIYEPRCTAVGITIERSLSPSRKVVLRRGEMMQAVSNLIANAINAMPNGGTLSVSVCDTTFRQKALSSRLQTTA